MQRKSIQPEGLFPSAPYGFSQLVVSEGTQLIHCAGQTANDSDLNFIGQGDFRAQLLASLENVRTALAAAGAGPENVVSCRLYVVDYTPGYLETIGEVFGQFFGPAHLPANTLIGVQALALPELMCEVEVFAIT